MSDTYTKSHTDHILDNIQQDWNGIINHLLWRLFDVYVWNAAHCNMANIFTLFIRCGQSFEHNCLQYVFISIYKR